MNPELHADESRDPATFRLAAKVAERLSKLWDMRSRINEIATDLAVLELCYTVRAEHPHAAKILLEVTDQGGDSMTFCSIETDSGGIISEDSDSDEEWVLDIDDLSNTAMGIEEHDLTEYRCWHGTGSRNSGAGFIDITEAIAQIAPGVAKLIDPMPDPNDLPAIEAWLEGQTT